MRRLGTLFLLLAASLVAADITGKWDFVATVGVGQEMKMEMSLARDDGKLTGTMSARGNTVTLTDVAQNGNDLTFKLPIGGMPYDIKMTLAGEAMKGTFSAPTGMTGEVRATRPAAAAIAEQVPAPKPIPAVETKVETGTIGGSHFRIDIPVNHNGGLVVYCHGYGGGGKFDEKPLGELYQVFLNEGFAIAQAGYSRGGWAIKEGIEDTAALTRYYVGKYGKPKRTVVLGHSMGGILTLALIEKFPELFDAAMPICGPLDVSVNFIQKRAFDLLVVFDYYYPGVLGSPVKIAPQVQLKKEYLPELEKILAADPRKKAALQKFGGFASEKEVAIGIAFFASVTRELMERAGGNPFDNRNTVYIGGEDDVALNRGVKRYASDSRAVEYVKTYYTPVGRLERPVLAIHNVYDPVVPAWTTNSYAELARQTGADKFFVQRWSTHGGHCNVKPDQHLHAFEDLLKWQAGGGRPEAGEQK
jgi:pimeloyl-ACP methyl ester carboxylesterase